ncbi:MAG: hypothetical protein FD144_4238 [Rhodospirillaceae bacterium]|nr:MAG: hypothetical protein FD144_4238 [Rhodospirillaceae bacterium]
MGEGMDDLATTIGYVVLFAAALVAGGWALRNVRAMWDASPKLRKGARTASDIYLAVFFLVVVGGLIVAGLRSI